MAHRLKNPLAPLFIAVLICAAFVGRPANIVRADEDSVGWPLETLTLKGQAPIQGVLVASDGKEVDFAEVVRPPGKPMFVVIRRIAKAEIKNWKRLDKPQRARSLQQLARFRNRVRIEQGDMDNVELTDARFEGLDCRRHANDWFTLWSTADDETTRRCVVRVDQMFRAYRQLFPPRGSQRRLRILLTGSLEQYGDYLQRQGLNVQNPAFYSKQQNLIVAASEVGDFGARLADIRRRHEQRIAELERMDKEFLEQFSVLRAELKMAGFKPAEITLEKNARLRSWKDERERHLKQITAANRRNDSRFHVLTQRMFRRLYHESLHAYLENHVYPKRQYALPRWFNEGLAQVFEGGQLEAGLLRVDAPDATLLRRLKNDLRNRPKLTITDLVHAQPRDFVDAHENPQADRYYLHAWAVAYYLTFISPRTTEQLDTFAAGKERDPQTNLERFAGVSAEQLDTQWRQAMIKLSASE